VQKRKKEPTDTLPGGRRGGRHIFLRKASFVFILPDEDKTSLEEKIKIKIKIKTKKNNLPNP